jgi:hypothetical protein
LGAKIHLEGLLLRLLVGFDFSLLEMNQRLEVDIGGFGRFLVL